MQAGPVVSPEVAVERSGSYADNSPLPDVLFGGPQILPPVDCESIREQARRLQLRGRHGRRYTNSAQVKLSIYGSCGRNHFD